MRKRTCDNLFDNIMWYTIYLLPIIITFLIVGSNFSGDWYAVWEDAYGDNSALPALFVFRNVVGNFDFVIFEPIYDVFLSICEMIGVVDSEIPVGTILYLSYFVSVYMLHLCVDFLLFIPRLAHKWLKKAYQGD